MSRYWYFAATLPGFAFGAPPPMTEDDFLARCRKFLTPQDYLEVAGMADALSAADLPGPSRSGFLDSFIAWERSLRNSLAILRAKALGVDPERWTRPAKSDGSTLATASACLSAPDPLSAEIALERERWSQAERLASLRVFDLDAIEAYRLKLAIASRLASLSAEAGEKGYGRIYSDILGTASAGPETDPSGVQS